jgi:imidazolonepropionase-like amidohydrolase
MLTRPHDVRERRRHARDQGPVEAGKRADQLVVNGVPWVDVTRLRRRGPLMLVMQDGPPTLGP